VRSIATAVSKKSSEKDRASRKLDVKKRRRMVLRHDTKLGREEGFVGGSCLNG
jgi:hypothetical protein